MSQSTQKRKGDKPSKPRPDFPLFPHATGRWAKKVRGKLRYFGKVADDPDGQAALEKWLADKDYLLAGIAVPTNRDGLSVRELVNRHLTAKKLQADSGEISPRTWRDIHAACARVVSCFGRERMVEDLRPEDFEKLRTVLSKTMGLRTLKTEMQRVRSLFKYAYDAALIDRPIRFGPTFENPSKRALDRLRQQRGPRMFEAEEIRQLLEIASLRFRGMILMGINVGFGNMDCATLPVTSLDLERGWVSHPRPKTAIPRRAPLWSETVKALEEVIAKRPKPKSSADGDLVFLTQYGNPYVRLTDSNGHHDNLGYVFREMLVRCDIWTPGRNFYGLRHSFETIGGEAKDQVAVDAIMGHTDLSMAAHYRERISDDRLRAVTEHVRRWLFPAGSQESRIPSSEANTPVQ